MIQARISLVINKCVEPMLIQNFSDEIDVRSRTVSYRTTELARKLDLELSYF